MKVLLDVQDVREALGECRTTFYGATGSYHDPEFPLPVRRPGRAPQWLQADIERFAASLADRYRASKGAPPAPRLAAPNRIAQARRGRPRKPRPFSEEHPDD